MIFLHIAYYGLFFFFFNDTATTEIYTLSLHDALPISSRRGYSSSRASPGADLRKDARRSPFRRARRRARRSEEHTSELQSPDHLVCRLLLEKKKRNRRKMKAFMNELTMREGLHPTAMD